VSYVYLDRKCEERKEGLIDQYCFDIALSLQAYRGRSPRSILCQRLTPALIRNIPLITILEAIQ
jgi:hypothetical protein